MLAVSNRVVMITGANRGIGKAIARTLAQRGYRLSLGARNSANIDTSEIDCEVFTHDYDARDKQSAPLWVEKTLEQYGTIDAVVLNAGVMKPVGVAEGSEEDLDLMWDVNFKGPLRLIRSALPALKRCGHGRVINIVSLSGKRVMGSKNLGYCASKYAALSLTHAIRQEGWQDGLRATAICPGLVDTDMVSNVDTPNGEFKISPDTIAATAEYALSLPNESAVAEVLVNSRLESMF